MTFQRVIGRGGFADVYLYTRLRPSRNVAVKVLRADSLHQGGDRQFEQEADLMASVSEHPHIVTIYGVDIAPDGRPFIEMEYYPGPDFGSRAAGTMKLNEVLSAGILIAGAVETAHRAGILHRDLKPTNILTSSFGAPGLTDFGISAAQGAGGFGVSTGATIAYAAPESLTEAGTDDARSDVYSLAATVYALLAGHSAFADLSGDASRDKLLARVLQNDITPITRADAPESLVRTLTRSMALRPEHRPDSALAFARYLQEIERELELQLTLPVVRDAVVPVQHGTVDGDVQAPDDDRTRLAPARVVARPVPVPAATGSPDDRTALRAPSVAPHRDPTTSQEPTPRPVGPDAELTAPEPNDHRWWWVVVVAAVIGVVVVAALARGSGDERPPTTTAPRRDGTDPFTPTPLPVTDVSVARVDGGAKVSWTSPEDDVDEFRVSVSVDGVSAPSSVTFAPSPPATVHDVPPSGRVCATVVAVRDDKNSDASAEGCTS
jgi:serine/threonine protein kinase